MYNGTTWTVDELLSEVKTEAALPQSSRITDSHILSFGDQAIRSIMSEAILTNTAMAGRWLDYRDILFSDGLRGGAQYLVPSSAASGVVSHVDWYQNDTELPSRLYPIQITEALEVQAEDGRSSDPSHWYFHDNRITLVPVPDTPASTARVRIWFVRAHPKLVETTEVSILSSVDTLTGVLVLNDPRPASWPSPPYNVDVYSALSPHAPFLTGLGITGGMNSLIYVVPVEGPKNIEDLDAIELTSSPDVYKVAISGQADSIQLPDSYRGTLTKRTASYVLRAVGHEAEANSLWGVSREDLETVKSQMQPRQKGDPQVWINRASPLRRGRRYARRWW